MARAKKTSAENVVQAAVESVKAAGELVAEEVKETAEKVISEDTVKSVAEVADKTKKAAETTEKAAKEVKSVLVPKLEIQTNGKSISAEDIIERCKAKYGKKKVITTLEVYVNIDESKRKTVCFHLNKLLNIGEKSLALRAA